MSKKQKHRWGRQARETSPSSLELKELKKLNSKWDDRKTHVHKQLCREKCKSYIQITYTATYEHKNNMSTCTSKEAITLFVNVVVRREQSSKHKPRQCDPNIMWAWRRVYWNILLFSNHSLVHYTKNTHSEYSGAVTSLYADACKCACAQRTGVSWRPTKL